MPNWLCKIWRFVANLVGKIVDFILEVVEKLINFVVKAVDDILSSTGISRLLLFAAIGLGAYLLLSSSDKGSDQVYMLEQKQ